MNIYLVQDSPGKMCVLIEHKKQVDQLVYKLCGLTEEEIKIVEAESSKGKGG